jgi:hypothetical protein
MPASVCVLKNAKLAGTVTEGPKSPPMASTAILIMG